MLLAGDIFCQPARGDIRQPVKDRLAPDTGNPAVGIEVRLSDFIGMESQYQIGTAHIRCRITAAGIGPIDDNGLRRVAQDVHGMEIAVAQAITIGRASEAIEQNLLSRLVKNHDSVDVRCQPNLQTSELVCGMGMDARVQVREDPKIPGYRGGIVPHLLRE